MKNFFRKNKQDLLCFLGLLGLLLLQYGWFGPVYWLQLDDYTHYRELAAGTNVVQLCIENGCEYILVDADYNISLEGLL